MTAEQLWHRGRLAAAGELSAVAIAALPEPDHAPFRDDGNLAQRWHEHGTWMWHLARHAEAERALRRAYELRLHALGAAHADTLATLERLAALDAHLHRDDAAAKFETVVAGLERSPVRQAIARRNHAAYLRDVQRLPEARAQLDRATLVLERELPDSHPEVIHGLKVDALLHLYEGSPEPARVIATRAVERATRQWSADHPFTTGAELTLAAAELRTGKLGEAGKRLPAIVERLEAAYGEHPLVALALTRHAQLEQQRARRFDLAEQLARRAVAIYKRFYPAHYASVAWTLFEILMEGNRPVDAADLAIELEPIATKRLRAAMAARIGNALVKVRDYRQALPWLDRARDASEDPEIAAKWAAHADKWRHYVTRFER